MKIIDIAWRHRRALLLALSATTATTASADHGAGGSGLASSGGMQIVTPQTLGAGQAALAFQTTLLNPEHRSDSELAALAGQHIHAHGSRYALRSSLAGAYGVTDRLTIAVDVPWVHHDGIREGEHHHSGGAAINSVVERGDVSGFGDATMLAKYRLAGGERGALALIGGIKMPTGSTRKRDDEGERFETEHQPGSGSWDKIVGVAAGGSTGAVQFNASLIYQAAGKGAMDTRLGDRAIGGLSLSHRFGPGEHHDEADEAPHGHRSLDAFVELTGEWEGRQEVAGVRDAHSGGRAVFLSPGVRLNLASGWGVSAAVGLPVWQRIRASHPDNGPRVTVGLGRSF